MKINVELVTPEQLVFSGEAETVEVPGSEGDFGILPNHAPMISTIRPGIVSIHNGTKATEIFIPSGFAEVTSDRCTILAENSVDVTGASNEKKQKLIDDAVKQAEKANK